MSTATVAVTGGTGYIGSRIIADLLKKGYKVNAIVRNTKKAEELKKFGAVNLFEVEDLINGDLSPAFKDAKYVIHVAAPVIFQPKDAENDVIKPAIGITQNVLQHALKAGIKRVVITSTMATLCGDQRLTNPDHVYTEEDWNDNPGSPYSKGKTLSERAAWEFVKAHPELEIVTLHPSLVAGPITVGQSISTVSFVADVLDGKHKESGYPSRLSGFVDVRDVSSAHIVALEHPGAANQRYILSLPDQFSLLEVAESVKKQFPQLDIALKEQEKTNPKKGGINNEKVQKQLGIKFHSFDEIIKDTILSLKEHGLISSL